MCKDSVHSIKVLVTQWCLTVCYPMDCSLPGYSVHGISQARILEWAAISFSRGSSQPRDQTQVSCIGGRFFNLWATSALFVHSIGCITISVLWIRKLKLREVMWPFHAHPANKWRTCDWTLVESVSHAHHCISTGSSCVSVSFTAFLQHFAQRLTQELSQGWLTDWLARAEAHRGVICSKTVTLALN